MIWDERDGFKEVHEFNVSQIKNDVNGFLKLKEKLNDVSETR